MPLNRKSIFLAGVLLACNGDAECLLYPCAVPLAATISVSAGNAPAGIPGLRMTVSGAVTSEGPCNQASVSVCTLVGGPGTYHVELRAPGYATTELNLAITGVGPGCNTCGHVDAQQVSVTMQLTGG